MQVQPVSGNIFLCGRPPAYFHNSFACSCKRILIFYNRFACSCKRILIFFNSFACSCNQILIFHNSFNSRLIIQMRAWGITQLWKERSKIFALRSCKKVKSLSGTYGARKPSGKFLNSHTISLLKGGWQCDINDTAVLESEVNFDSQKLY